MHVRLFDLYAALVVVAAVLTGSTGQQVLAVVVGAALVVHRVAVTHAVHSRAPSGLRSVVPAVPQLQPAPPVPHP